MSLGTSTDDTSESTDQVGVDDVLDAVADTADRLALAAILIAFLIMHIFALSELLTAEEAAEFQNWLEIGPFTVGVFDALSYVLFIWAAFPLLALLITAVTYRIWGDWA